MWLLDPFTSVHSIKNWQSFFFYCPELLSQSNKEFSCISQFTQYIIIEEEFYEMKKGYISLLYSMWKKSFLKHVTLESLFLLNLDFYFKCALYSVSDTKSFFQQTLIFLQFVNINFCIHKLSQITIFCLFVCWDTESSLFVG